MNIQEMKIGEFLELQKMFSGKGNKEAKEEYGGIRIVVLQRGWVAIGKYFQKGHKCWLENAATIRIWGTSGKSGLSYLADNGPTDKTILDKTKNKIMFHELTIVHMYNCEKTIWEKHL